MIAIVVLETAVQRHILATQKLRAVQAVALKHVPHRSVLPAALFLEVLK